MNQLFVYYKGTTTLFAVDTTNCGTLFEMNLSPDFDYQLVKPDGQLALL